MMLEVKHYLRKRKLWIALASVIVCSGLLALNLKDNMRIEDKEKFTKSIEFANLALASADSLTQEQMDSLTLADDGFPILDESISNPFNETLINKAYDLQDAASSSNFQEVNRLTADITLMLADRMLYLTQNENYDLYIRDYFNHSEKVKQLIIKRNLPLYINVDFENYGFDAFNTGEVDQVQLFPYFQFSARFYEYLQQNDIDHLNYSQVDSGTIIIQFIRNLFPLIPIILIALLFFDSISEDRDSGVLKTILSQAKPRRRYLNKKIFANCISAILIFIIPFVLMSISLGIFDQFKSMQAPALANVQGLNSFIMLENPMADPIGGEIIHETIGISDYMALPGASQSPNAQLDFIPMWQFAFYSIILSIFVIIFCVMLNTFLNVICKNKLISLILSIAIVIGGIAITSPENYELIFAFLPFTFMNPVHIVSGYYTYSFLNGIIVLSVYSIILYAFSVMLFKRKDIA